MAAFRRKPSDNQGAATKDEQQVVDGAHSHSSNGIPVDRGWAWVVMAAAFGIFGLHGASFKSHGIVYIEMLEHFASDQQVTLWLFSISGLVTLSCGPLVSHIIQKTSHRTVLLLGAATISGGIIMTGYLPVLEAAFFSWGILYGFGHSCLMMASLTCTAQYFQKYRGLALGITAAGSGLLSLVMPLVLRYLFDTLTFQGSMLIYGGITCQLFLLSALVRPTSLYLGGKDRSVGNPSVGTIRAVQFQDGSVQLSDSRQPCASGATDGNVSETQQDVYVETEISNDHPIPASSISVTPAAGCPPSSTVVQLQRDHAGVGQSKDPGSVTTTLGPNGRSMIHLLRDVPVVLISVTMMFFANGMNIVFTAMPAFGESAGVPKETVSMLLAIGGGIEVFCRGLHGWFSDKKIVSSLLQMAFCSGVTGLASVLCPILGGAVGIGVLSGICGFAGTSAFSLVPIVLHELVGPESMATALGIQMFMRGLSFILSTFVAGYVVEKTGSWDGVFYYIGTNSFISTVLTIGVYLWNQQHRVCSRHTTVSTEDIPPAVAESLMVDLT